MKLRKHTQLISQLLALSLLKLLLLPFVRRDTTALAQLKKTPHLLVANHVSMLDGLLVPACLSYTQLFRISPAGMMLANKFYDSFWRPLAWAVGCFPAKNPQGNHKIYGVPGSVLLLDNKFSVIIFPEGKLMRNGVREEPRPGVVNIHQERPNVPMILCHVVYNKGIKNLLAGRAAVVRFKYVTKPNFTSPKEIMDIIYRL